MYLKVIWLCRMVRTLALPTHSIAYLRETFERAGFLDKNGFM